MAVLFIAVILLQFRSLVINLYKNKTLFFHISLRYFFTYPFIYSFFPFAASRAESIVMSPDQPSLTMTLSLIRSDQTYSEPEQLWQFVSNFAVRDYSGLYIVRLLPCTVTEVWDCSDILPFRLMGLPCIDNVP